jgi:hypothetical protein
MKLGRGEQDTCGVNSHTKKAIVKAWHIFYADATKQQGYVSPSLHNDYDMAASVWDMRAEEITRVQFRKLADLVKTQAVTTKEELLDAKVRVLDPAKGVSFTPRKKPRFLSESSWEYAEDELLPAIEEAPSTTEGLQDHIVNNWSAMLKTVEMVRGIWASKSGTSPKFSA